MMDEKELWIRQDERNKIVEKLRKEANKSNSPLVYPIISKYIEMIEDMYDD